MKIIFLSHQDVNHIFIFALILMTSLISAIKIDPDGGYKDIVIRIAEDGSVPENDCPKILYNIKVSAVFYLLCTYFYIKLDKNYYLILCRKIEF